MAQTSENTGLDGVIERLKLLRLERELTQEYVALRLGRAKQWLQNAEQGDRSVKITDNIMSVKITDNIIIQWAVALNSPFPELPLVYEDPNLVVAEPKFMRDDSALTGGVYRASLTRRDIRNQLSDDLVGRTGYFLNPYLLRLEPGAIVSPASDSVRYATGGFLLQGDLIMYLGGQPEPKELHPGDSYSCSTSHSLTNSISSTEEALLLIFQLGIQPSHIVRTGEYFYTDKPKKVPLREHLFEANQKSFDAKLVHLQLYPSPCYVTYAGNLWSEEVIVVTEGKLELITRSPEDPNDKELKRHTKFELKAPAAVHMDGRIFHIVSNPSIEHPAKYVVARVTDAVLDSDKAYERLEMPKHL